MRLYAYGKEGSQANQEINLIARKRKKVLNNIFPMLICYESWLDFVRYKVSSQHEILILCFRMEMTSTFLRYSHPFMPKSMFLRCVTHTSPMHALYLGRHIKLCGVFSILFRPPCWCMDLPATFESKLCTCILKCKLMQEYSIQPFLFNNFGFSTSNLLVNPHGPIVLITTISFSKRAMVSTSL